MVGGRTEMRKHNEGEKDWLLYRRKKKISNCRLQKQNEVETIMSVEKCRREDGRRDSKTEWCEKQRRKLCDRRKTYGIRYASVMKKKKGGRLTLSGEN